MFAQHLIFTSHGVQQVKLLLYVKIAPQGSFWINLSDFGPYLTQRTFIAMAKPVAMIFCPSSNPEHVYKQHILY